MKLFKWVGNHLPIISVVFIFILALALNTPQHRQNTKAHVPILMYHSIVSESTQNSAAVTVDTFRLQMQALRRAGYQTITYHDLVRFVTDGIALPDKPLIITFDDGYKDNLTLAAPILAQNGFCAQIAVIGCSLGKSTYKNTAKAITPHFSIEDALPWVKKSVIYIQSHSFDMHQTAVLDGEHCRNGALPLPHETEADYASAIKKDVTAMREILAQTESNSVFVYPYGQYNALSERVLTELGVSITVSTDPGIAEIVYRCPQSLRTLPRIAVSNTVTAEELLVLCTYR